MHDLCSEKKGADLHNCWFVFAHQKTGFFMRQLKYDMPILFLEGSESKYIVFWSLIFMDFFVYWEI